MIKNVISVSHLFKFPLHKPDLVVVLVQGLRFTAYKVECKKKSANSNERKIINSKKA